MGGNDFFAFCTLLRPLELKALGELSQARHLPSGETIYRTGDASETFYIVNRGVVELIEEGLTADAPIIYLSRGDIFGDGEVLTNLPRKNLARAREGVSIRCFHKKNFPELLTRVPSFFRYLSEQLAERLVKARDAALSHSHQLELSGNLANFDLVTIYQTIVNSSQTGELSISDEKRELFAAFFFEEGVPRGGQYQHLAGEEAFWQLFLAENLCGTFTFFSGAARVSQTIQASGLVRSPTEMLITALQWRDEFEALKTALPDRDAYLECNLPDLCLDGIDSALHPAAEEIWRQMCACPTQLGELYGRMALSEGKIYQTVDEMARSGQLSLTNNPFAQKVA